MSGALVAVSILSAACGADPDLQSKSRSQKLESRAPNPSLALDARWVEEATQRLSTAFWWRSAERFVYAGTLRWAVAYDRPAREAPQPRPPALLDGVGVAGGRSVWDQLAQCESGGNWAISTGNGFYGGIQFTLSSWRAVGGSGLPSDASREEQIARGQALQRIQGWGAWPACSRRLGLR